MYRDAWQARVYSRIAAAGGTSGALQHAWCGSCNMRGVAFAIATLLTFLARFK